MPQTNLKSMAEIFSTSWLLNWTNYSADSVEEIYKRSQRFMSPRLLNQTRMRLNKDIEQVKKDNRSSLFSLDQDPQVSPSANGFDVVIVGHKGTYLGKEEIKIKKMVYHLKVIASPATDFNPYGLIIEDISIEDGV